MRKSLQFIMLFVLAMTFQTSVAQCVINTGNTTNGFTPNTLPCATQGTAYAQATQLHVPSSVDYMGNNYPVTSVQITSITGMPAGISYNVNPTTPIPGNGNGCVDFSGTTTAAVGTYPLTVNATATTNFGSIPITFDQVGYTLSMSVCAGGGGTTTCDTFSHITASDDLALYGTAKGGYLSGNNGYGDLAKAERFTSVAGSQLSAAIFYFGQATSTVPSRTVDINVWNEVGGEPGSIIATKQVPFSTLIADVTNNDLSTVTFNSPITLTGAAYYIGVTLPTITGDTIAIVTNDTASTTGEGWEKWEDGTWNSYPDAWSRDYANFILPIVCVTTTATPPVAAFTADKTTGCSPLTVKFTDQSTNAPTSWSWSFPGATVTTSTAQNPTVTYNTTGTYNVTLTATNANGSDPEVKTGYITVTGACPSTCDTLFNYDFDSLVAYRMPNPYTGWLTGRNSLGDLGSAEAFTTNAGNQLTAAWFAVAAKTGNAATVVTFNVWDATGTGGTPGAVIGTATKTLGTITASQYNYVAFSPAVTLPANFYVGYNFPTAAGDTLALFSSTQYQNYAGGWIKTSTGAWTDYSSRYGIDFSHAIDVSVCPPPATGTAPVAAFTASTTAGCGPLSVQFTDQSTNTPTSWSWSFPGATVTTSTAQNPTVTYNTAGTYNVTLTATNANGSDPEVKTGYITVYPKPVVTLTKTDATCLQAGSVTSSVTGGSGFGYLWSYNTATSANLSSVPAGSYTVTVTNSNTCTGTATTTVGAAPSITASAAKTDAVCNQSNGTVTASATGGTGYTYQWADGPTGANRTGVAPGTYSVTVTASNGCTATATATVGSTGGISTTLAKTNTTCNLPNGTITSTTTGGSNYTYLWNDGLTTANRTNLAPGTYSVTVTSSNGCTASASATVASTGTSLSATASATATPACNQSNGTVTVSVTGGTPAYNYAWNTNPGQNSQSATNLPAGSYTVTVTDNAGCTTTSNINLTNTGGPTASITGNGSICAGGSTTLTASGGGSYQWSNGLGTNAQVSVSPGATVTYTVTVTGSGNCIATATKVVTVNNPATSIISKTICSGSSYVFNGAALTATGTYKDTLLTVASCDSFITLNLTVNPPLTGSYSKTICSGSPLVFNGQSLTSSGSYKDTIQTVGGCDSIVTLILTVNPALTGSFSHTTCTGTPYVFNGQALTSSGTYKDTIQTSGGCDSIVTLNLTVNPALTGSFTKAICAGDNFVFNGQSLTAQGSYKDTIQTSGGCDSIVTLVLTVNPLPTPTVTQNGNVLSTQNYSSYQWLAGGNNINNAISQSYTAPASGSYSVVVTDANGCSKTSSVVVLTVGINEVNAEALKFNLYPNPAESNINIVVENSSEFKFTITNYQGQEIANGIVLNNKQIINVANYQAGVYIVEVKSGNTISRKRFTKL
jgi:PKD repeat protein